MTNDEILAIIRDELGRLAPEIDFESVNRDHPIQQEFDIDSMDFLNFVTALHERTGVNVPESDYGAIRTVNAAISYLSDRQRD